MPGIEPGITTHIWRVPAFPHPTGSLATSCFRRLACSDYGWKRKTTTAFASVLLRNLLASHRLHRHTWKHIALLSSQGNGALRHCSVTSHISEKRGALPILLSHGLLPQVLQPTLLPPCWNRHRFKPGISMRSVSQQPEASCQPQHTWAQLIHVAKTRSQLGGREGRQARALG